VHAIEQPLTHDDADQVDVIELVRVVWRYRYFIGIVAAACGLAAVALALTTTHIYRAEVVVTEVGEEDMGGLASLASQFGGLASMAGVRLEQGGAALEAQAVLRSHRLVEEFIRRNELLKELLPIAGDPPTVWFAVKGFQETVVSIVDDEDRGTTTVAIQWTDPKLAANWANNFVALANQIMRTRALEESSRNIKYLNDQISKTNVVEIQRVMYNLIENETKTHMLANGREEYAFRVVDPAVIPEQRIWPRRTLMVLTGGVLGVILGVILALTHNLWRKHRVRLRAPVSA
jgi:uncharacterized protein involved in exopolysaccharide biosynthesis